MNRDVPFAFSFPVTDHLLISEFGTETAMDVTETEQVSTAVGLSTSLVPESQLAEKISRVAHYIYQKVVRRKAIPYQPSPKNPKYLLCYVEEELECGHKLTI